METKSKLDLAALLVSLSITVESVFVPYSLSRNFKPDAKLMDRSLNWKVTLKRGEREILTTDYQAGIAHCPSYPKRCYTGEFTLDEADAIIRETETGKAVLARTAFLGAPILPKTADVVYALVQDAEVIDYPNFEAWACDMGYDTDSREAERIYRACLEIALAMRTLGETTLAQLREAYQDY